MQNYNYLWVISHNAKSFVGNIIISQQTVMDNYFDCNFDMYLNADKVIFYEI